MKATGTVRNNRTGNCPLTHVKTMQKKDRGEMEIYSNKDLCAVIELSEKYAREHKNDPTFVLSRDELWDFIMIITISCYNMRPQFSMYWSINDDTSCPLIRSLMARNKFTKIKSFIHVCDNDGLTMDGLNCVP